MQTYYDYALKQWVTRLPNGTTRAASVDEATIAAQQQAGTQSGPGGNYSSSDSGRWATGGAGTGTGSGPGGNASSSDSMRWVTGYQAPPPPSTDPYQNWLSSDAGSRSYRYLTPDLQAYYEQHPDEAYRQYTTSEYGDRQTPLLDYARGRYQDYWAQYIKASETNPNLHFTDTLSNNLADQIRQGFTMQSPSQKGYQLTFMPAGRSTF